MNYLIFFTKIWITIWIVKPVFYFFTLTFQTLKFQMYVIAEF
jgi:hypothetical protein